LARGAEISEPKRIGRISISRRKNEKAFETPAQPFFFTRQALSGQQNSRSVLVGKLTQQKHVGVSVRIHSGNPSTRPRNVGHGVKEYRWLWRRGGLDLSPTKIASGFLQNQFDFILSHPRNDIGDCITDPFKIDWC
jgi:hypothetical protein